MCICILLDINYLYIEEEGLTSCCAVLGNINSLSAHRTDLYTSLITIIGTSYDCGFSHRELLVVEWTLLVDNFDSDSSSLDGCDLCCTTIIRKIGYSTYREWLTREYILRVLDLKSHLSICYLHNLG